MSDFALAHPAFNKYQIDATYDEMLAGDGAPRPPVCGTLPATDRELPQTSCVLANRPPTSPSDQGITFTSTARKRAPSASSPTISCRGS